MKVDFHCHSTASDSAAATTLAIAASLSETSKFISPEFA